jgi:hypothetical protein
MELDLKSLFGLLVQLYYWLRPRNLPPFPRIWTHIQGHYWSHQDSNSMIVIIRKTLILGIQTAKTMDITIQDDTDLKQVQTLEFGSLFDDQDSKEDGYYHTG